MVCLKNAKYRGTLGRNEGGAGGVQAVFVVKIKKYRGTFSYISKVGTKGTIRTRGKIYEPGDFFQISGFFFNFTIK